MVFLVLSTDKLGRRRLVFISAIVCTVTMLVVAILGLVPKTPALQNFLIFDACLWSFFSSARKFSPKQSSCEVLVVSVNSALIRLPLVGSLGWAFVGEVASQRLRARTAGLAAGASVIFGLTFNTAVPIMRKYLERTLKYGC